MTLHSKTAHLQFVPDILINAELENGDILFYDDEARAFINVPFPESTLFGDDINAFESVNFVVGTGAGEVAGPVYELPIGWVPSGETEDDKKNSLIVTWDGIKQHKSAYHLEQVGNGYKIIFDYSADEIRNNELINSGEIEITGIQLSNSSVVKFTKFDATQENAFDINWIVPSKNSLIITINGVMLSYTKYSILADETSQTTRLTLTDNVTGEIEVTGYNLSDVEYLSKYLKDVIGIKLGEDTPNSANVFRNDAYGSESNKGLFFKSLVGGNNITIVDSDPVNGEVITIDVAIDSEHLGNGVKVISVEDNVISAKSISGGNGIDVVDLNGDIIIDEEQKYYTASTDTHLTGAEHIVGISGYNVSLPPTITLPSASVVIAGKIIVIKDEDGSLASRGINVVPLDNMERIDGSNFITITEPYGSVKLYSNGSNWFQI